MGNVPENFLHKCNLEENLCHFLLQVMVVVQVAMKIPQTRQQFK
jgi:hypothetical protein